MKKRLLILILNIAIIILDGYSLITSFIEEGWLTFKYYTHDSNILLFIVCVIDSLYIIRNKTKDDYAPKYLNVLKLSAVSSVAVTFLVVIVILAPMWFGELGVLKSYQLFLLSGHMLYQHLLCPVIGIISYILFACDKSLIKKDLLYSLIPSLIYAVIIVLIVSLGLLEPPYPFLDVLGNPWYMSIMWFVIVLSIIYALHYMFYKFNQKGIGIR